VNAGDATVDGVEADFSLKVGKLTFSGSGAYNDAKLSTNFCNLGADLVPLATCSTYGQDLAAAKGTRLPRQPRFKMNLTARYDTTIGRYKAFFQGSVLHQSSATSDLDQSNNEALGNTPAFETFDVSGGLEKGNWHLSLFLNNMFDNRGQLTKNTFCSIQYCSGSSRTYPVKPQFFGIKFGQKF
jgi:outer membrane receptor protein involved in Fe transport